MGSLDELQEEKGQKKAKLEPSMVGANQKEFLAQEQAKIVPSLPCERDASSRDGIG